MGSLRVSNRRQRRNSRVRRARPLAWLTVLAAAFVVVPLGAANAGAASAASTTETPARPNIVMLMADDLTLEQYQHFMPKTRARLEHRGVTYDNSLVSFSECCPSRATFLTGQYAHNHGVQSGYLPTGGASKLDATNALPVWLQSSGYYTAQIGKYMNGYGVDTPPTMIPPGWNDWFTLTDPSTQFYWDYTVNDNGTMRHFGTSQADYRETVETNRAVQTIDRLAGQSQPFFLDFNPSAPHIGYPNAAAYTGQALEPTSPGQTGGVGYYPPASTNGALSNYTVPHTPDYNEADISDKPAFRQLPPLTATQVAGVDNWYRKSTETVMALDDNIATIIDELEAKGVLDNTVLMFTSDNGVFFGEHRIASGKDDPFEPSVRVPLVVGGPGFPVGIVEHRPVVNVDINPTIVAAAGATAGRAADGRPLQQLVNDPNLGVDRPILLETGPLWGRRYYRAVRTTRWKYIEYSTGERELYDFVNDPYELSNQADQPSVAADQLKLRNMLLGLRACKGAACLDPPLTPTGHTPPVADAGAPFMSAPGQAIYLIGQDSFDPDGGPLTYKWTVAQGSSGVLASDQVIAISGAPWTFGHLVYRLTVTDQTGLSASSEVAVDIGYPYHHPITNAGADQVVLSNGTAPLSATGSSESGTPVSYVWTQSAGPAATIASPTSATTSFVAPTGPATLTFTATVTDATGLKGSDAVSYTVIAPGALAPVTVTAGSASKAFGQAVPAIGFTTTGSVASAPPVTPTCKTSATASSLPGTYPTTCTGPATDGTYRYTYVPGVLTLTKAATATTLALSSATAGLGDTVTLTANTVTLAPGSGSPGAYVVFYDWFTQIGAVLPVGGRATMTTAGLSGGAHIYTASFIGGGNFAASNSPTAAVSVTPRPVTIRAGNARMTFGASLPAVTATATGALAAYPITPPTCSASTPTAAGLSTTTCTGPAADANYTYSYSNGILTVDPTPVVITAQDTGSVLGQPVAAPGYDTAGAVAGFPITEPTCTVVVPDGSADPSPVGTYPTRCSGLAVDGTYTYRYVDGTHTVAPAAVTVQAASPTIVLGDSEPAITATFTGSVPGIAPATPVCPAPAITGAGTVPTHCTGPAADANYAYLYLDGTLTVDRTTVTVQASSATITLGEPVPDAVPTVTGSIAGIDSAPPVCSTDVVTGAGTVATRCAGPASDTNYRYDYRDGALTVDRAPVVVTAASPTMAFGTTVPSIAFAVAGAVPGVPITTPSCGTDPVTDPGVYPTICTGPAADSNYDYGYVPGTLTVGGAHLAFVADSGSITAGASIPTIGFHPVGTVVASGAPVTPTCAVVLPDAPGRGTFPTHCTGPSADGVYEYTYIDGTLDIGSVTITAAGGAARLGDATPGATFSVTGADPDVPITPPTCATAAPDAPAVGAYPTQCTGPASDAAYDYRYIDGTFTVTPAPVDVQAPSASLTLGDPVPTIAPTFTGTVAGIAITPPSCAADPVVGSGVVATRCTGPASDGSYDYRYLDGSLSVGKATVTFEATSTTTVFGDPAPVVGFTPSGAVAGVAITPPSCTTAALTQAGTYPASCTGPATDANYTYTYNPGTVIVSPRPVQITASTLAFDLGAPLPPIGYLTDGQEIPGTPITVPTCSGVDTASVGDHPTTCTGPATDPYYAYTYVDGIVTVRPAPVTVTATSAVSSFGTAPAPIIPILQGTLDGTPPAAVTCATTVTAATPPGTYPATCTGPATDATYRYTYVAGTVTVGRAPVQITASSATIVLGDVVPAITASITGTASGTPAAPVVCSVPAATAFGIYQTACTGVANDAFYTYTYIGGTLTISRPITTTTLTVAPLSAVAGQPVVLSAAVAVLAPGRGSPSGSVQFYDSSTLLGSAGLVNGQAALTSSTLAVGNHTITAAFREDSGLLGSTSVAAVVSVAKAQTAMALASSVTAPVFGQSVTLTAVITVPAPGSGAPGSGVVFSDGATTIGSVASSNGRATFTTTGLGVGTHQLTATYQEGGKFFGSTSAPLAVTVGRAATITGLTVTPGAPAVGQPVTLTATVAAIAPGVGVPGAPIEFVDGTTVVGAVVPGSGKATLTLTLARGSHTLLARYIGGGNFAASASTTITVTV